MPGQSLLLAILTPYKKNTIAQPYLAMICIFETKLQTLECPVLTQSLSSDTQRCSIKNQFHIFLAKYSCTIINSFTHGVIVIETVLIVLIVLLANRHNGSSHTAKQGDITWSL